MSRSRSSKPTRRVELDEARWNALSNLAQSVLGIEAELERVNPPGPYGYVELTTEQWSKLVACAARGTNRVKRAKEQTP